jgi:hypothetical protein
LLGAVSILEKAMSYAYSQFTGDGSTQNFTLGFPYIAKAHVKAYVNSVEDTTFTWNSSSNIRLTSAPANAAVVVIKRVTPRDALVDFTDASTLTESNLDTNTTQLIYLVQEQIDAAQLSLAISLDGTYDAGSRRIKNVATPTASNDAVTKAYADTVIGTATTQATNAAASATGAAASKAAADARRCPHSRRRSPDPCGT